MNNKILWIFSALGFYLTICYRKVTAFTEAPDWGTFSFWYFIICLLMAFTRRKSEINFTKTVPICLMLVCFIVKQHFDAPRNFIMTVLISYLAFLLLFLQQDYIKGKKILALYKNILLLNIGYIFFEHLLIQSFFGNFPIVDKFARGVTVSPWLISLLSIEPLRIDNVANEGTIYFPQSLSYEPQSVSTLCLLASLASICIWNIKKELKVLIFCIFCIALSILNITSTTFIVLNVAFAIYICLKVAKISRNRWVFSILVISFLTIGYLSQDKIFILFDRPVDYISEITSAELYFGGFIRWAGSGLNNLLFGALKKNDLFGTELFPLNVISECGLILTSIFVLLNLKRFFTLQKILASGKISASSFFWLSQLLLILATSIHYGIMFACSIWPLFVISLFECCRICSSKNNLHIS